MKRQQDIQIHLQHVHAPFKPAVYKFPRLLMCEDEAGK